MLLLAAIKGEPFGSLPTKSLGVHRTLGFQDVVQRRQPAVAARREFFAGQGRGIGQAIILEALGVHISAVSKVTEAARIEARHVDFGVPVNHPLGKVLSAAGALCDPE